MSSTKETEWDKTPGIGVPDNTKELMGTKLGSSSTTSSTTKY